MNCQCKKLDLFLSGELSDEDALRFESHVVECEACREAIDEQHWIDGLLRSHTRLELEPAPAGLSKTVRVSMMRRRYARLSAFGFAAAAAILIAAGWLAMLNSQAHDVAEQSIAQAPAADAEPSLSPTRHRSPQASQNGRGVSESPRAVFEGGADVFVAAVESRHPNVTIVRLYPTYKPSLASNSSEESSDVDEFNGG